MSKAKILVVDDEKNVLDSFQDNLRKHYNVSTAICAKDGIKLLEEQGPFAVVISDMMMPDVDGAQFLAEVRARFRDTTRILLTGQASAEAASRAVNEGGVYRFIMKPCATDVLLTVLAEAVEYHQRSQVESELLKTTLFSSMEVMSEVLSIVNPVAFSRGGRVRGVVAQLAKMSGVQEPWLFEIAAMLSQLGCVTLPPDLLEKVYTRDKLTEEESQSYKNHPEVAYNLLHKVPRMEQVALMIRNQNHPESPSADEGKDPVPLRDETLLGARFLFLAGLYEDLRMAGAGHKQSIERLHGHFKGKYGNYIDAINKAGQKMQEVMIPKTIDLDDLVPGMVLSEDVFSDTDVLLMAKGQRITSTAVGRLMGFDERIGVRQPFRVMVRKT